MPFKIKGLIDKSYGKFPDGDADKLMIVEYKYILKNMAYWSWIADYMEYMMVLDSG